jgi:8-oxo-dGTP pyrophosphatase MutT (NUDIX family)
MKIDIFTGVVLVDDSDRVFLIKEEDKNKIGKNRWNLPGGSIDDNESFLDSARRETLEETGYNSQVGSIVGFIIARKVVISGCT